MPETAHQGLTDYPLPGPEEWKVDLFSAETGRILTGLWGALWEIRLANCTRNSAGWNIEFSIAK